ncbi:nucleotidyltransferase family protein [Bacillus sp. AK031]
MIKSEEQVLRLIKEDEWMLDILKAAKSLQLPDWWVCAGFVRSKIWDTLHGFQERTTLADVDVVYFDKHHTDESIEKELEEKLKALLPDVPWSVKNQARMHLVNGVPPYKSSVEAISKFPETVTAVGVKLDVDDTLILTAPHGIEDVLNMKVKPVPFIQTSPALIKIYEERIHRKDWQATWTKVKVSSLKTLNPEN